MLTNKEKAATSRRSPKGLRPRKPKMKEALLICILILLAFLNPEALFRMVFSCWRPDVAGNLLLSL